MPHQNIELDRVLSGSGQDCVDLSPIKNYFWMGPKLLQSHHLLLFRCFTTCSSGRLQVVRAQLLRKMPHQNIRLDRDLSDSGQHCVDLNPVKNYNFGWAQNFIESPSSLVHMFYDVQRKITCCSDGTLAQDASPEH